MLLTITTTHQPATDLGYLLHKHPDRFQSVKLSVGKAHVFYPESSPERTTAALLLDIDPIDLVRTNKKLAGRAFSLGQYVNDRPYVASSFLSVAIAKAFSTALNGSCTNRPELVDTPIPLEVELTSLPAPKGGEELIRSLFKPLGYKIDVSRHELDPTFPDWGDSKYYHLKLRHTLPLHRLLTHLYVLIPVLDNDKHYYIAGGETQKLLTKGKGWLEDHPLKETITRRYLGNFASLTRSALEQLTAGTEEENVPDTQGSKKDRTERTPRLHQLRLEAVAEELDRSGATSVIDLGCGEGKLLQLLKKNARFDRIAGTDVAYRELTRAMERLRYDELSPRQRERITLFQGSLMYRDDRLNGFDAAALVEVIEHLDENRLRAFERVVFEFARPKTVVVTTPNADYNVKYEFLKDGEFRHPDHRFEWTRAEFIDWSTVVATTHQYTVDCRPLGPEEEHIGASSQLAVFKRIG